MQRFFAVVEKDPPPLLSENFESDDDTELYSGFYIDDVAVTPN